MSESVKKLEDQCSKGTLRFLGCCFYVASFVYFPMIGALFFLYLLIFTQFWYLSLAYLAWCYYDYDTPANGGRRVQSFCDSRIWEYMRDYFPITLHKTAELSPEHNYIMGYHPHGITVFGAFCNFGSSAGGFRSLFPKIQNHLMTIEIYYKFPFFREYIMTAGCRDVRKESYIHLLTKEGKGKAAIVVPGGAEEALDSTPDKMTIILTPRHGFIKMALRTGAHLVPIVSFGENDTYKQVSNPRGGLLRKIQMAIMKVSKFSPPLFYGRFGKLPILNMIPFKTPINTVVGKPISVVQRMEPSWTEVCELHQQYTEALRALFEEQKTRFGYSKDYELEIL